MKIRTKQMGSFIPPGVENASDAILGISAWACLAQGEFCFFDTTPLADTVLERVFTL